ncbi:MAG: hypothetical protein ACPHE2_01845, partial [Candidatus Puniceispirillaceae bacterium]
MSTSLREEMISLSLFGGRLALAELILFSVFLTDILLLGIMGEINLSGVLLAKAMNALSRCPMLNSAVVTLKTLCTVHELMQKGAPAVLPAAHDW